MAVVAGGLPLVPLSPLVKSSIASANALALAHEKLLEAKQTKPPVTVDILRRLIEDTRVQQSQCDQLNRHINSVQAATAFYWDPDVLARQIAVIDCQLFEFVILQKQWLCQLDKQRTKLVHLLDFHWYLTHSFAHQLIYWSELAHNNAQVQVVPPVHPKDHIIAHLVRVAYLLVHAYRDFSGFAAIMRALAMPGVRRLDRLWQSCPSRTKEIYRELTQIMSPAKNYQAYHTLLGRKLEFFHQLSKTAQVTIAIPWMKPHLSDIRSIVTAYAAGNHDDHATMTDAKEVILSSPGAQKLSTIIGVLELCQRNSTTESSDLLDDFPSSKAPNHKRMSAPLKSIQLDGLRSSVTPVPDLNRLAPGDTLAHHWLVSRVFLTKDQLMAESTQVEPLRADEEPIQDTDEEESYWETHEVQQVAVAVPPSVSKRESVSLLGESDQMPKPDNQTPVAQEHSSRDDSDSDNDEGGDSERVVVVVGGGGGGGDGVGGDGGESRQHGDNAESGKSSSHNDGSQVKDEKSNEVGQRGPLDTTPRKESESAASDTADKQQVAPSSTAMVEDMKNKAEHETKASKDSTEIDLHNEWSKQGNATHDEQGQQLAKSTAGQSLMTTSTHPESTASKRTKKSTLSPTAPVFIPSSIALSQQPVGDLAVSYTDFLPMAPTPFGSSLMRSQNNTMAMHSVPAEEDPEEQWHGYTVHKSVHGQSLTDTESEKWTGYPVPSKMDEDDEDWKGYPAPEDTTDSTEGSPHRVSSQSEESEGWKGYRAAKIEEAWQQETKLKVQEHDWQGYALETLNEDELDSSTMMNGEFQKSRQARQQGPNDNLLESFRHNTLYKQQNNILGNADIRRTNDNRWVPGLST